MAKVSLDKILKKKKLTKYKFAQMLGVDRANVTKYFKDDYDPRLSTLERWAAVLNVSIKDLVED